MATTFDGKSIVELLKNKDAHTVYYEDNDGNKKKFFEIIKRYADDDVDNKVIETGNGIDIYMSWAFEEGNYQMEYLVDTDFIKNDLDKDVDLELIDTDVFSNQLTIHKDFLINAEKYESTEQTQSYIHKVAKYYDDNELNIKSKEYTNLHRYYIFRKRVNVDNVKNQTGGNLDNIYNFSDATKFKIPEMLNYDNKHTFINSIHKILVAHNILPKHVSIVEFIEDLELSLNKDHSVDDEYIKDVAERIIINHAEGNINKNILDGLKIFIVERDCNNFYDISYNSSNKKNNLYSIVLMRDGELYRPLLRRESSKYNGLFKSNDEMIKYLSSNGDKI
jgi:hypothetical protein